MKNTVNKGAVLSTELTTAGKILIIL